MADQDRKLNDDLDDLRGDAKAAADHPMTADPGTRDPSARGGPPAGVPGGIAAGGGLAGPSGSMAAGGAMGDGREGGDPAPRSAVDTPSTSGVTLDQRPNPEQLGADADRLQKRLDEEHRQASELGRLGPGGSGVGNTIAPQSREPNTKE